MVGKTLGHYEILEPLGKGGMGEVCRAGDTTRKREVACRPERPRTFSSRHGPRGASRCKKVPFGAGKTEIPDKGFGRKLAAGRNRLGGSPRCLTIGNSRAVLTIIAIVP